MGRPQEKETAEDSRKISIWWLKKQGFLNGWISGSMSWTSGWDGSKSSISFSVDTVGGQIRFWYTQTSYWSGEKREMDYTHGIVTTPCHYGGVRYWFRCDLTTNGRYCGRRVGVLYKSPGSWYWGCRHCHRLTYDSRRVSHSNPLYSIMDLEFKCEKLEEQIKRRTWRGRPTRKYRRLLRMYRYMDAYMPYLEAQLSTLKRKIGV